MSHKVERQKVFHLDIEYCLVSYVKNDLKYVFVCNINDPPI